MGTRSFSNFLAHVWSIGTQWVIIILRDYIWWKQQVGNTDFLTWLIYPPCGLVPMSTWKIPYRTFFFGLKQGFQSGFFRFGQKFSNLTLFLCTWKNHYFEHLKEINLKAKTNLKSEWTIFTFLTFKSNCIIYLILYRNKLWILVIHL